MSWANRGSVNRPVIPGTDLGLEGADCESLVGRILAKIPAKTRRFTADGFYRDGSLESANGEAEAGTGTGTGTGEMAGRYPEKGDTSAKQTERIERMLKPRCDAIARRNLLNLRLETFKVKSHCKPLRYDSSWKPLQKKPSSDSRKTLNRAAYLPTKEQRRVAEKIELFRQNHLDH